MFKNWFKKKEELKIAMPPDLSLIKEIEQKRTDILLEKERKKSSSSISNMAFVFR